MRAKSMELMDQIISFIDQFYSVKHISKRIRNSDCDILDF